MDAWRPAGLARAGVHGPDALQRRRAGRGAGGRRAVPPSTVARLTRRARSQMQRASHGGDREHGLVRVYEPEGPGKPGRISREPLGLRRRCAFRRGHSLWQDVPLQPELLVLAPQPGQLAALRRGQGGRRRRFPPALGTVGLGDPDAINCAVGSNSRARSSGHRPARTSPTLRRRNSGECGGWVLGIGERLAQERHRCPPNRSSPALRGSCRHQSAPSQQVEPGAAVALPLEQLEPVDLCLGLAAAAGQGGTHRRAVLLQAGGKRRHGRGAARAGFSQPGFELGGWVGRDTAFLPAPAAARAHKRSEPARQLRPLRRPARHGRPWRLRPRPTRRRAGPGAKRAASAWAGAVLCRVLQGAGCDPVHGPAART